MYIAVWMLYFWRNVLFIILPVCLEIILILLCLHVVFQQGKIKNLKPNLIVKSV